MGDTDAYDVRVEGDTVIVELPAGLELDKDTGERINREFAEAVRTPEATSQLTILNVEDPLGSGLFEEVKKGGELAADNGITRWAVVVTERIKGMAFESKLDGLETEVFERRSEAEAWLDT
jgi:hypothetical protein